MLISESHRFIFVHNRKAAGTSMRRHLMPLALPFPQSRWNKVLSRTGLISDFRRYAFRRHDPIEAARARMPDALFASCFKFAFVRNPWDRLVAEYEFLRRFEGHRRHRRVIAMSGFREFVEFQIPRPDAYQWPLLVGPDGALCMDFIGRFERLGEDFEAVRQRIDPSLAPLPHHNRGQNRDYRAYYDSDTVDRVARHWQRDIETFGYRFE